MLRRIHQIWIGSRKPPHRITETWEHTHTPETGFQYKLWRASDIDTLPWGRHRATYDRYLSENSWHGAADVARVEILKSIGGIYIDADIECLHPLHGAPFLGAPFWVSESPHVAGRPQTAAMGCEAGHPLIKRYAAALGRLATAREIKPPWVHAGSGLLQKLMPRHQVLMLPAPSFHPYRSDGKPSSTGRNYKGITYGRHFFYTTNGRKPL